ncbi:MULTISPECIES: Hsp20/alpha crystallin family protein [Legionella]|uniref:Heat shock protein, Hsp20 family n=1 Tax=Legionella maceachernii TaxID=466 RepID=A0A0W0WHZ9_9GAMM|nr:Hsp20/alpha crystallin family protein [Legionella maceachernii]KTD31969.1 heat shock protein, Hsp20 family [Legionella maceachernii]SKA24128.1 HSP20 family protein [Legionella maceachernii]SUP04244.1 Spore protein SP21 [Legionella maceachernii]
MSSLLKREYFPMQKDFGKLLENFFRGQLDDSSFVDTGTWAPAVDIKEEKDRFLVVADIPGVKKEDMNISLENNILTLHGSRSFEKTEKKEDYTRIERSQGQFYRRFSLPETADDTKISAKYKHGVLEISIPKKKAATQKKIDVKIDE